MAWNFNAKIEMIVDFNKNGNQEIFIFLICRFFNTLLARY
jgi:hypothetical protein